MKNKILRSILFSTLALGSVLLSACDDSPQEQPIDEATNEQNLAPATPPAQPIAPKIEIGYTLTDVTLANLLQSVIIPLQKDNVLTKIEKTCLKTINSSFAQQQVQSFFLTKFTPEEMEALNAFYESKSAIAYTKYGREQLLISAGLKVNRVTQRPKRSQMKKVKEFTQSPLGQKYMQVVQDTGEGSLVAIVMPLLKQEIKKCGITL
ncbi:MAG: hypothetical protein KGV51_07990 [Moraxellaceae bacterium]|nr:hypothetical protein [Moraxellaceae bacterium]